MTSHVRVCVCLAQPNLRLAPVPIGSNVWATVNIVS